MKCTGNLATFFLLFNIAYPVQSLYFDPFVLQDIRAAQVADRIKAKYIATPSLQFQPAQNIERYNLDHDEAFIRRGAVKKFMTSFSTAGARKAKNFARHNPTTTTVLAGAIGAQTVYSIFKSHHDDDHHHHDHKNTVIYVNTPAHTIIDRREPYGKKDFDQESKDGDEDEEINLSKRATGPVDSFMGKTIKKGAVGTKKFAKNNPWTAAVVGGTILTAGAVKLYNQFRDNDKGTQVIHIVDSPAYSLKSKRGIDEDSSLTERNSGNEKNKSECSLTKRAKIGKAISRGASEVKYTAKKHPFEVLTAALLVAEGIQETRKYMKKKKANKKKEAEQKIEVDKRAEADKKSEAEKKAGASGLVKRGFPNDGEVVKIRGLQMDKVEVDETILLKRGPPQSSSQRVKAFVKTKKGKMIVGGMVAKSALTVGVLYYMRQKSQKQAQIAAGRRRIPDQIHHQGRVSLVAPKQALLEVEHEKLYKPDEDSLDDTASLSM